MITTTDEQHRHRVITRSEADLIDGAYFRNHKLSYASIRRTTICSRRGWAHAVQTLGKAAATSDLLAQIAAAVLKEMPLYQTDHEAAAKVYDVAGRLLAGRYEDVVGMAAPDAGAPSSHVRDFTLADRIAVAAWLEAACSGFSLGSVPGFGWTLVELAEREHVTLDQAKAAFAR